MKLKIAFFNLILGVFLGFSTQSLALMPITEQNSSALIKYYVEEYANILNHVQLSNNTSYMLGQTAVSDSCISLINKDLILGRVGHSIYSELTKNSSLYPFLMEGGKIKNHCKNYSTMDNNQRAVVWLLVLTTMAHFESSCNSAAKAKGPNGTAYGYFQLHKGKEFLYAGAPFICPKNASLSPMQSSKCALGMLEKQMDRTTGELFSNKSYWEVLRPKGPADKAKHISKAIARSSLCNPKTM